MLRSLRTQLQRCAAPRRSLAWQRPPVQQFKRFYIYGGVQPRQGPPRRHGAEFVRWVTPEHGSALTTFDAQVRPTKKEGLDLTNMRREELRVPIVIHKRVRPDRRPEHQINASIPESQLMPVVKRGTLYNQVFEIRIEGREEPVKAIVASYEDDCVIGKPVNVSFTMFEPGQRCKIKVPCYLENMDDAFAIKNGALVQKVDDYIPMYWRGDEYIPQAIVVDLLNAKPPTTFKLQWESIPEGLTQRHPNHMYTLATLKGSRKYYRVEEEEEE